MCAKLAEQAALVFGRTPEGRAAAERRLPSAGALALAGAEGLTLHRSQTNASGFMYVNEHPNSGRYQASVPPPGNNLGSFSSGEMAALAVARWVHATNFDVTKVRGWVA